MLSFFVANWKMNGSLHAVTEWLNTLETLHTTSKQQSKTKAKEATLILCPPSPYLSLAFAHTQALSLTNLTIGAQNVYFEPKGAFTGEISASMLRDVGCTYVLIGHSERRRLFQETDNLVAQKCVAAHQAGLTPIVCVGESQADREAGQTQAVVESQLSAVLQQGGRDYLSKTLIAYEPLWAIGTGITATPEQAQSIHANIRGWLLRQGVAHADRVPILYGGSVTPDNAVSLMQQPDIQGLLVGGASLKAEEFWKISSGYQPSLV